MEAVFRERVEAERLAAQLGGPVRLDDLPGVHAAVRAGGLLRCAVDNASLNEVLRRLTAAGVRT